MAMSGANPFAIQKAMGHKDTKTTMIYLSNRARDFSLSSVTMAVRTLRPSKSTVTSDSPARARPGSPFHTNGLAR